MWWCDILLWRPKTGSSWLLLRQCDNFKRIYNSSLFGHCAIVITIFHKRPHRLDVVGGVHRSWKWNGTYYYYIKVHSPAIIHHIFNPLLHSPQNGERIYIYTYTWRTHINIGQWAHIVYNRRERGPVKTDINQRFRIITLRRRNTTEPTKG